MPPKRTARFQTFQDRTDPADVAPRLAALRAELQKAGLDAFLVPRADRHRGEDVAPSDQRLAFVTGFTGSAGMAVVTAGKAAMFVDGRYALQAPAQTDTGLVTVIGSPPEQPADWMRANLAAPARIGFDPWLHTPAEIRRYEKALNGTGLAFEPTGNLVDLIWKDRPPPPAEPVTVLVAARAGASRAEKLASIRRAMQAAHAGALVLTLPECICWLFNIRGSDIGHAPVTHGFAVLRPHATPQLFLNEAKLTGELVAALGAEAELLPDSGLPAALDSLGE